MRLVGHGHSAIRATHAKTLELSRDTDITTRATCVVAVGVAAAPGPLAGPVRITIEAGGLSFALDARANSSWDPAGPAVIRRSPLRRPDTLATHASAAASDLPRELVAALRAAGTTVELTVEPIAGPPTAVLFALDDHRPDPRLRAELAAADIVVAEDQEAADAVGERVGHGPVAVRGRVLVLAARELPGATVLEALRRVPVETVGLSPTLAAAAAAPARGPLLVLPTGADLRTALRTAPAGARIVVPTTTDRVPVLLGLADELRGPGVAVLARRDEPPVRLEPGDRSRLPGQDEVYVCLVPGDTTGATSAELEPAVRAAMDGLLADGVATKAVANAIAILAGWDRRRAYAAVVARRSQA